MFISISYAADTLCLSSPLLSLAWERIGQDSTTWKMGNFERHWSVVNGLSKLGIP